MTSKWTQEAVAQDHPFFSKLPPEIRDEILSYLPETEVSALRKCCQQFHGIVAAYESHHATPHVNFHMRRLQNKIDAIKNTSLPTDADTLLAGLGIWTSTRGIFFNTETSLYSLEKWFSYLADDHIRSKDPQPFKMFETWALVAMQAVRLKTEVEAMHQTRGAQVARELHWAVFQRCLSSIENLPLSEAETKVLFDRIRGDDPEDISTRGDKSLKAKMHFTPKEHTTFPGHHDNNFRISPIRVFVGDPDKPEGKVRGCFLPAKVLRGYLGLPDLPDSDTFCYCVKKGWVTELLKQRYKLFPHGVQMNLSMRAAVLQWVEIF